MTIIFNAILFISISPVKNANEDILQLEVWYDFVTKYNQL